MACETADMEAATESWGLIAADISYCIGFRLRLHDMLAFAAGIGTGMLPVR